MAAAQQVVETAVNVVENAVSSVEKSTKTVSSKLKKFVSTFESFLGKHNVAIANVILTVFVAGGEELLEIGIFRCPSDHSLAYYYALAYTIGIAISLWFLGIAAYNATWKLLHGCFCLRNFCKIYCGKKEDRNCLGCCKCHKYCCECSCSDACFDSISKQCYSLAASTIVKTLIIPFAWIIICLWDGDYLACMMSETPSDTNSTDYKQWKNTSRMYGYGTLPAALIVVIFIQAIYRCFLPHSYVLHRYIASYRTCEDEAFREKIPDSAGKLAKNVVKSFLDQKDLKGTDWEETSEFLSCKDSTDTRYYSPLHMHVVTQKWLKLEAPVVTTQPPVNPQLSDNNAVPPVNP